MGCIRKLVKGAQSKPEAAGVQTSDESMPCTLGYLDRLVDASACFLSDWKRLVGDVYYCREVVV
jgi:hypothetical protein